MFLWQMTMRAELAMIEHETRDQRLLQNLLHHRRQRPHLRKSLKWRRPRQNPFSLLNQFRERRNLRQLPNHH